MTEENNIDPLKTANNSVRALESEVKLLKQANANLTAEVEDLKKVNIKMAEIEDARLATELSTDIQKIGTFSAADLEGMKTEEMLRIKEILLRSKGVTPEGFFKPIRAGNASSNEDTRLTVGSTYGKTREEILKSGGEQ